MNRRAFFAMLFAPFLRRFTPPRPVSPLQRLLALFDAQARFLRENLPMPGPLGYSSSGAPGRRA